MPKTATKDLKKEKEIKEKGFFDKFTLSETLILATIPFASYAIVFFYEWGYFSVFKIPIEFITFDLSRIFLALLSIVGFGAGVYYFSELIVNVFSSQPEPIRRIINKHAYRFVFVIVLSFFTSSVDWKTFVLLSIFLIIFLPGYDFLFPLISQRKVKGYIAKLAAQDKQQNEYDAKQEDELTMIPLIKAAALLGRKFFFGLFVFICALFLTYQLGEGEARTQIEFQVINTNPERVVLWIYNDYALCASFDRITKEVGLNFIIINVGEDPNIEYSLEEVGPLKLRKTPSSNVITISPTPSFAPIFTLTPTSTRIPKPTPTTTSKPIVTP